MIPIPDAASAVVAADPLVLRYRPVFAQLDWSQVPERDHRRPWPGRSPHPRSAYIKALLVKLTEHLPYITDLRRFLVEHPLLVLDLGFRPVPDPTHPWGFDVERTVPGERWLRHQQQTLDATLLQALLRGTVSALQQHIPELGETVALDVKHLFAWVAENNPKETIPQRFDPTRHPHGDPDCRLGVKWQGNQAGRRKTKTFLWGYGTGIAAATHPTTGDVVLAEYTQPFNHQDVTWAAPLWDRLTTTLGHTPTNLAADAAFDAWPVYDPIARQGGIAAIAPNHRGHPSQGPELGPPRCARGLAMVPTTTFLHEDGYQAQRYRCPLLVPTPTGQTCDQPQFQSGRGCVKARNLEPGGRLRRELDRSTPAYRAIYRQRTAAERINSQAVALGIERPKVRRQAGVERLTTLTYILINARVLQRLAAHSPPLC
jgi:hypothetical protein